MNTADTLLLMKSISTLRMRLSYRHTGGITLSRADAQRLLEALDPPETESPRNYDQSCDMVLPTWPPEPLVVTGPLSSIRIYGNHLPPDMRGTGVEPVSLSAPDPKSRATDLGADK